MHMNIHRGAVLRYLFQYSHYTRRLCLAYGTRVTVSTPQSVPQTRRTVESVVATMAGWLRAYPAVGRRHTSNSNQGHAL